MKIRIIQFMVAVLTLLGTGILVRGGIWEPNPTRVFRLGVNSIESYTMTEADELWVKSLVKNLVANGGRVAKHHVFIRTNGIFTVGDQESEGAVYINRNDPDQFITTDPVFFVDFVKSKVDMFVFGARSLHPSPNKNFVVIIDAVGGELSGIPVSSGGGPPKFSGREVTWY
jgi:hypothetical protein